jgi:hypothetical protein
MSDLTLRLVLIGGALVVTLLVLLTLRFINKRRPTVIDPGDLLPGIYLFSSSTCLDCQPASAMMLETLGTDRFTEFTWEDHPQRFQTMGIASVPATVVVDSDRSALLFTGMPAKALERFSP